jgi:hypothetical protein
MNRNRIIVAIASCLLLTALTAAQTPAPPAAEIINVSVLVTENKGDRPVTGLRIDHLRLLEDQEEQTILSLRVNSLSGDYTLSYTPKNAVRNGGWRRVRVEIVGPLASALTLRHAAGYHADPFARQ